MMKSHLRRSLIIAAASPVICAGLPSPSWAGEVSHAIGVVNGFNCDIWRWLDFERASAHGRAEDGRRGQFGSWRLRRGNDLLRQKGRPSLR